MGLDSDNDGLMVCLAPLFGCLRDGRRLGGEFRQDFVCLCVGLELLNLSSSRL